MEHIDVVTYFFVFSAIATLVLFIFAKLVFKKRITENRHQKVNKSIIVNAMVTVSVMLIIYYFALLGYKWASVLLGTLFLIANLVGVYVTSKNKKNEK